MISRNLALKQLVESYLRAYDTSKGINPIQVEEDLLTIINDETKNRNQIIGKELRWKHITTLENCVVSQILLELYPIKAIYFNGVKELVIYVDDGENQGLHTTDTDEIKKVIKLFNHSITSKGMSEVIKELEIYAPVHKINDNKELIAVNNGIFHYREKQLHPFSSDYVFMTKSPVNYNPSATNISIHNTDDGTDWDFDSWLYDLADDKDMETLLWQVIGAIIRPHVSWNKVVCFYAESGNNGKGTLCQLMRNICGENNAASIPFNAFEIQFALEQLTSASAIITDENDVKSFNTFGATLKAVITGDVIQLNRKYKSNISFRFKGLMVQCLNDFAKFLDKSDSLYRRFLIVPFTKSFTGAERKYIKEDYLQRKEVLEHILYTVLHMNYYELDEPQKCNNTLAELKIFNDPSRQFLDEILPQLAWDLVPFQFLYDLYKAWCKINAPSGKLQSRVTFIKDIKEILKCNQEWKTTSSSVPVGSNVNKFEQLIAEYNLTTG